MAIIQISKYYRFRRTMPGGLLPDGTVSTNRDDYQVYRSSWDDILKIRSTSVGNWSTTYPADEPAPGPPDDEISDVGTIIDEFVIPLDPSYPGWDPIHAGSRIRWRAVAFVPSQLYQNIVAEYSPVQGINPVIIDQLTSETPGRGEVNGKAKLIVSGGAPGSNLVVTVPGTTIVAEAITRATEKIYNLPPGTYRFRVDETVNDPGEILEYAEQDVTIRARGVIRGCTDSTATNYNADADIDDGSCEYTPPEPKEKFHVPLINSIRFVRTTPLDNFNNFPNFDNQRFCGTKYHGRINPSYAQKYIYQDVVTIQFQSNYSTNTVKLFRHNDNSFVQNIAVTKKVQNKGITRDFKVWIKPHTVANQSRVYFNSLDLPVLFIVNERVEILNTPTMDGNYTILELRDDNIIGAPYLVVNAEYDDTEPRVDGALRTQYDTLPYDVYEFTMPFQTIPKGYYYVEIGAQSAGFPDLLYHSEPIYLALKHALTTCLRWRNFDNTDEIDYSTGILHIVRVESEAFEQWVEGKTVTTRNPNGSLVNLSSQAWRKFKWSTYKLPGWLHEKLAVAIRKDFVQLNGMLVQCPEGYNKPTYFDRYTLADSFADLEEVDALKSNNGQDSGDIDGLGKGYVLVRRGYLRRR